MREIFFDVEQLADERVFAVAVFEGVARTDFFNRAKHFHDQHAVMRDDGAAAFADDVRMRHFLRVANVGDVINDVVRVFLQGVIRRAVKIRAAAVVIHAQPAAHVHEFDRKTHLVQLRVKTRRLLHRFFHRQNVRHLRADVKMQQLQTMAEIFRLQHFRRRQQFHRAQAELRVFAAALRPFARALAQQPRADADERLDAKLLGKRR